MTTTCSRSGESRRRGRCSGIGAFLLISLFLFAIADAAPLQCYIDSAIGSDANDCSAPGDPTKTCNSFSRAYSLGCACINAEPGTYDGPDNRNIAATYCPKIVPTTPGDILINLEDMGRFVDYNFANAGGLTQFHSVQITNGLTTSDGGAIRTRGCNLLANETFFWHNRARGGGAIYGWTSGAASTLDITIINSRFKQNEASQTANAVLRRGGAICMDGNPLVQGGTTLSIDPTLFEDNTAAVRGGAISLLDVFATIEDTTFLRNSASPPAATGATGGAVFIEGSLAPESAIVTFDNSTFRENKALNDGNHGGGVASTNQAVTVFKNSFFCSNEANGLNGRGGATHADNGDKQIFTNDETVFQCNTASITADNHVSPTSSCLGSPWCQPIADNGGLCDACEGGPTFPGTFARGTCYVSVGDFGNPVGSDANVGSLAAPFLTIEKAYLETCKRIRIFGGRYFGVKNRGQTIAYGPIVERYTGGNGEVTVDLENLDRHVTVTGTIDTATYIDITFVNGNGPSPGGSFFVQGLIVGARAGLELDQVNCSNSEADGAGGHGGCVYIENGLLDVKDSEFNCNTAEENGGAIYIVDDAGILKDNVTQTITRSSFRWNQAILDGGAIHVLRVEKFELTYSLFEHNRVPSMVSEGGALVIRDTWQSEIQHNVFSSNIAERHAGAIENIPVGGSVNNIAFVNDTFCNNVAVRGAGGAYRRTATAAEVFMSLVSRFQCNEAFTAVTDHTSPTTACGEDAPPSCVVDPALDGDNDGICDRCDTRINPGCGLSVAIVLPQTATIDATEAASLIGVLKDWLMSNHTEMTVAFYGYNTDGTIISSYADLTDMSNVIGLKKRLDDLVYPGLGGGVNWADVLNLIGATTAGGAPDYVIFFADVQPNFPGSTAVERAAAAAASATLQANGARVIGVDLGSAQASIDDISGPNPLGCAVQDGIDFFDLDVVADFDSVIHSVIKDQLCCEADKDSCGFCGKVLPKEARCNGCNACVNATACPAPPECVMDICVTNATYPSGVCDVDLTALDGTSCIGTDVCILQRQCLAGACQGGVPAEFIDEPMGCRDTGAAAPCTFDMCMPDGAGGRNCTHTLKTLVPDTKCLPGYNSSDPTHDPRFWCGCDDGLFCTLDRCRNSGGGETDVNGNAPPSPGPWPMFPEGAGFCRVKLPTVSGDVVDDASNATLTVGDACNIGGTSFMPPSKCVEGLVTCNETTDTLHCVGAIGPDADETCGDGIDNDCDGVVDEGCTGVSCNDDSDCAPFAPQCSYGRCNQNNLCVYDGDIIRNGTTPAPVIAGMPCNDNMTCTVGDVCQGDGAIGVPATCAGTVDCDDGVPCHRINQCNATDGECIFPPRATGTMPAGCDATGDSQTPDMCEINCQCDFDDGCVCQNKTDVRINQGGCDDRESCTIDFCNSTDGTCFYENLPAWSSCMLRPNPNDPCVVGKCVLNNATGFSECTAFNLVDLEHEEGGCDDLNSCTRDFCLVNSTTMEPYCVHDHKAFIGDPCNDKDACTDNDRCQKEGDEHTGFTAWCKGDPITCNDGKECTEDTCDKINGCEFTNRGNVSCSFSADACDGGQCVGSHCIATPVDCSDRLPCEAGVCTAGVCQYSFTNSPCDDNDECTFNDRCRRGVCQGTLPDCDDSNPCTDDVCNSRTGQCENTPNAQNACTDNDPCTIDECNGSTGQCDHTPIVCPDTDPTNPCNWDVCVDQSGLAVCINRAKPDRTPCDDGLFCTEKDECWNGECEGVEKDCDDGFFCNGANTCSEFFNGACRDGPLPDCDDNDLCTIDTCSEEDKACHNDPHPLIGQACGLSDVFPCQLGWYVCNSTTGDISCHGNRDPEPEVCGDSIDNNCNGVIDEGCGMNCVTNADCLALQDLPCWDAICNITSNKCAIIATHNPCNDSDPCTQDDQCVWGQCRGDPVPCSNPSPCIRSDCNSSTGQCEDTVLVGRPCDNGDPCDVYDTCRASGVCRGTPFGCNDGNPCTTDSCNSNTGQCEHVNNMALCDDGDLCTENDVCHDGTCSGDPKQVPPASICHEQVCDPATGEFVEEFLPHGTPCESTDQCALWTKCRYGECIGAQQRNCDDGDPCTDDSCISDLLGGCFHQHNTAQCDDGDACTTGDQCNQGRCEGSAIDCSSPNPCVTGVCDPTNGQCLEIFNSDKCDDGDACTTGDRCKQGECHGWPIECDDGVFCNGFETCNNGTCEFGTPPNCNDENPCTQDLCDENLRQCVNPPLAIIGTLCGSSDVGECQFGMVKCDGITGQTHCLGNVEPQVEVCDGLDNNCDGVIDEGCGETCVANEDCPPLKCYDVVCTIDNRCHYTPNHDPCDHWNPCVENPRCYNGTCQGEDKDCSHPSPCVDGVCDGRTGNCVYRNNTDSCDDGDLCTFFDQCRDGECRGARRSCNDGNPCTDDQCNPRNGQCIHRPNTAPCDDGDGCTTGDRCFAGECQGEPVHCYGDDDDEGHSDCVRHECNPSTGQCEEIFANHNVECHFYGDLCVTWAKCYYGRCVPVLFKNCDDGDPCTDTRCNPSTGQCETTFNSAPCDDGDACTEGDTCSAGQCNGTPKTCTSANLCLSGYCDHTDGMCKFIPNSVRCDDGNACTLEDHCVEGECKGTWEVNCDDGWFCNGQETCNPTTGQCETGTPPVCEDNDPCTLNQCSNELKMCVFPRLPEEGNPCGVTDVGECQLGWLQCAAGQLHCIDNIDPAPQEGCDGRDNNCNGVVDEGCGQACVDDDDCPDVECMDKICSVDNLCEYTPNHDPCDHENPCIVDEACKQGSCQGEPRDCEDGDPCTHNYCDFNDGQCKVIFTTNPCDDGDECTAFDTCDGRGECAGTPRTCNDNNPCTRNSCNPSTGLCEFPLAEPGTPCDDWDACTDGDQCDAQGHCKGTDKDCDDNDPCTVDVCDPWNSGKCEHTPGNFGSACDDLDDCTEHDQCQTNGQCAGERIDCDDNDPCTDDSCVGGVCRHVFNTVPCDDQNLCTENDRCTNGQCLGVEKNCENIDPCISGHCDAHTGQCVEEFNSDPCDDKDPCTEHDHCKQGTCAGDAIECDDGWFCNGVEFCSQGTCQPGVPPDCDDHDPCTVDSCSNDEKKCLNKPKADIGKQCGVSDVGQCQFGVYHCNPGTGELFCFGNIDPAPQEGCDGRDNNCNGVVDEGCGQTCLTPSDCEAIECFDAICNSQNLCQLIPNHESCDDGDLCTENDKCYQGRCQGEHVDCSDDDDCTDTYCDRYTGRCEEEFNDDPCDDHDPCTVHDRCDKWTGECSGTVQSCDDKNPCTDDLCNPTSGVCEHTFNRNQCDDKNPCTENDQCNGHGGCVGTPRDCDDSNPCTADFCDLNGRCQNPPANDGGNCNDGKFCTIDDRCLRGQCVGEARDCDDKDQCTDDVCDDTLNRCVHTPHRRYCNDSNPCTVNDRCNHYGVCEGEEKDCSNPNPCISSYCNATTGQCVDVFNSDPCDDKLACTTDDKCWQGRCKGTPLNCTDGLFCNGEEFCSEAQGGICVMGVPPLCDDLNPCTVDFCNDTAGECQTRPRREIGRTCGVSDVGECKLGHYICNPRTGELTCAGHVKPVEEICDNRDNDCDGIVDEGCGVTCGNVTDCPEVPCRTRVCLKNMTCAYFKVIEEGCVPTVPDCGDHGWLVADPYQEDPETPHDLVKTPHQCLCRPGWDGRNCTECARPRSNDQRYLCHKTCDKDCAPKRMERPPSPWSDWVAYFTNWESKWGGRDDDDDEDWIRDGCFYKLVVVPKDDVEDLLSQDDDDDDFERTGRRGLDCECRRRRELIKFDRPVEDFELNKISADDDDHHHPYNPHNNKPPSPSTHEEESPSTNPHGGHDTHRSPESSSDDHHGNNPNLLWLIAIPIVILIIALAACGFKKFGYMPRPATDMRDHRPYGRVPTYDPHQQQQQYHYPSSPPPQGQHTVVVSDGPHHTATMSYGSGPVSTHPAAATAAATGTPPQAVGNSFGHLDLGIGDLKTE